MTPRVLGDPIPTGEAWEAEASRLRARVVTAAMAWARYRKDHPLGTYRGEVYAGLCEHLDRVTAEYEEIIRAY